MNPNRIFAVLVLVLVACGNSDSDGDLADVKDAWDSSNHPTTDITDVADTDDPGLEERDHTDLQPADPFEAELEDPQPQCTTDYDCKPGEVCGDGGACQPCEPNDSLEICDGLDNNCDGVVDEGCDQDNDGYCDSLKQVVKLPNDHWPAVCPHGPGDCDDANPNINPGATEVCGSVDTNCDGQIPKMNFAAPQLIRRADPMTAYPAMTIAPDYTSGSFRYAAVWQEELAETAVIKFARINMNTGAASEPIMISAPGKSVFAPSIAWDSESKTFGVTWFEETNEGFYEVVFTHLDSDGTPLGRAFVIGRGYPFERVTIFAADGHFGMFYWSDLGIWASHYYAAFNISTKMVSEPVLLEFPFQQFEYETSLIPIENRLLIIWADSYETYMVGQLRVSNGQIVEPFVQHQNPAGLDRVLASKFYVIRDELHGLLLNDSTLVHTKLNADFEMQDDLTVIASDAVLGHGRFHMEGVLADSFIILYQDTDDFIKLLKFNDFNHIPEPKNLFTVDLSLDFYKGIKYFYDGMIQSILLVHQFDAAMFFDFFTVTLTGSVTSKCPVYQEATAQLYDADFMDASYDGDNITILQAQPGIPEVFETYQVPKAGPPTRPTVLPELPFGCSTLELFNGKPRCISEQKSNSPCEQSFSIFELQDQIWVLIASVQIPGVIIDSTCTNGKLLSNYVMTSDGLDGFFRRQQSAGYYMLSHLRVRQNAADSKLIELHPEPNASKLEKFEMQNHSTGLIGAFVIQGVDDRIAWFYSLRPDNSFSIPKARIFTLTTPASLEAFRLATTDTSAGFLLVLQLDEPKVSRVMFRKVSLSTGNVAEPMMLTPELYDVYNNFLIGMADDTFVFNLSQSDNTMTRGIELYFAKPNNSLAVEAAFNSFIYPYFGMLIEPDYLLLAGSVASGLQLKAYNHRGDLLSEQFLTQPEGHGTKHRYFYADGDFRLLRSSDYRLSVTAAECR